MTLQKATAATNGYHGSAIHRCNEAKLIVEALDTHESHDGIAEVRKALHKVQEAAVVSRGRGGVCCRPPQGDQG